MFAQNYKKILKLIYNLTRKGRQFIWEEEQQNAFEEIRYKLIRPLIIHMPNHEGRFCLYLDMSKFAYGKCSVSNTGWKPKLIAYVSKDFLKQQELFNNKIRVMQLSNQNS